MVQVVVDGHRLDGKHAEGVERRCDLARRSASRFLHDRDRRLRAVQVLVVHAHPDPESFGAAVRDAALVGLRRGGHEVTVIDLAAENYEPCLTLAELDRYDTQPGGPGSHDPVVADHLTALRAAEVLVFTYPTFWTGLPAVLKGWIDRTLLPGAAFTVRPNGRVQGELRHVRSVIGITTYGSPRSYRLAVGDGGKRTLRSVRRLCGARCRLRWLALDAMDTRSDAERTAFLADVDAQMAAL